MATKMSRRRVAGVAAAHLLKNGMSKKYSHGIARFLLEEKRTRELDSLLRDIQMSWIEAGFVEVIATSAHPLDDSLKESIIKQIRKRFPSAREISVTQKRDPAIIGGVRVSLPDSQLDLSIEAKLNRFKQLTSTGRV